MRRMREKAERHSIGYDEKEWRQTVEDRRKARLERHSHGGHSSNIIASDPELGGDHNRQDRVTFPDSILQFGLDSHDDAHEDAHGDAHEGAHAYAGDHADDHAYAHVHIKVHMPAAQAHSQAQSLPSSTRHRDMAILPDTLAATTLRVRAATLSETLTLTDEISYERERNQVNVLHNASVKLHASSPPRMLKSLDASELGNSPTSKSWLRGNAGSLESMMAPSMLSATGGFSPPTLSSLIDTGTRE